MGNRRSGRRKTTIPIEIDAADVPRKPSGLSRDASKHWDLLVGQGDHLTGRDNQQLQMAAELWVLYRKALSIADQAPSDPPRVAAVNRYGREYRDCVKLLCLDVLGRRRAAKEVKRQDGDVKELKYFG